MEVLIILICCCCCRFCFVSLSFFIVCEVLKNDLVIGWFVNQTVHKLIHKWHLFLLSVLSLHYTKQATKQNVKLEIYYQLKNHLKCQVSQMQWPLGHLELENETMWVIKWALKAVQVRTFSPKNYICIPLICFNKYILGETVNSGLCWGSVKWCQARP